MIQLTLSPKMTSATGCQNITHCQQQSYSGLHVYSLAQMLILHLQCTYEITPEYEPFTILRKSIQNEIEWFCMCFSSLIRFTVLFVCTWFLLLLLLFNSLYSLFWLFVLSSSTVLAINLDFNTKLKGLVNELRGEIGATLKGSKDAKDRLLRSEYVRLTK